MRNATILSWMMIFSVGLLVGCEEPVADEVAIRKVKSLVVVPLQTSASDPSEGAVAAGMISSELQEEKLPGVRVMVAPVIWRMTHPTMRGMSDAQAMELAKALGVDAVVTGSVQLTLESEEKGKKPKVLKAGQVPRSSVPKGEVVVTLRLLSAGSGTCIYKMNGRAKGNQPAKKMEKATDNAVEPLIRIWQRGERGW